MREGNERHIPRLEASEGGVEDLHEIGADASIEDQQPSETALLEAAEKNPEATRTACVEDTRKALDTKLTPEQKEAIAELSDSMQEILANASVESNDDSLRGVLEGVLKERYGLSLEEILGAFRPTKLELLFPGTTTQAIAGEVSIFALSQALDVKPADLSLSKKIEYRGQVSADMLKIFALIAKFIPVVSALAIPAGMAGATLERTSRALAKVTSKEDSTIFDGVKEVTLAMLPRDENGNIDREAVKLIIEKTGGKIAESDSENEYIRSVGEYIQQNPELVAAAAEELFSEK